MAVRLRAHRYRHSIMRGSDLFFSQQEEGAISSTDRQGGEGKSERSASDYLTDSG